MGDRVGCNTKFSAKIRGGVVKPMHRLCGLVIASVVLGAAASASAQTWTLGFTANSPDTVMTQSATFSIHVTNTGTTPITVVSIPFPSSYTNLSAVSLPGSWNNQT